LFHDLARFGVAGRSTAQNLQNPQSKTTYGLAMTNRFRVLVMRILRENPFRKYYQRSKLWQTHDPKWVVVFYGFLISGFGLLITGIIYVRSATYTPSTTYSSAITNLYGIMGTGFLTPANHTSEIRQFYVPTSYMNETIPVEFNFILSSESYFVQNTLFQTNVTATIENSNSSNIISINDIEVQFQGAIDVQPSIYSPLGFSTNGYEGTYSGTTYLYHWHSYPDWQGSNYVTFQNNGSISCVIRFGMTPNYSDPEYQTLMSYLEKENSSFKYTASFPYVLPSIQVRSYFDLTDLERSNLQSLTNERQQTLQTTLSALLADLAKDTEGQSNASESMNIGLTCVIIFLSFVEVSFIIYEHSKDEGRTQKYYDRKSRENKAKIEYDV
jgi:hypothetical protein